MPKDNSIQSVLIIGSGPIIIGQACEFDYSGSQAARSLREEGIEVTLINSNPATIMTDPLTADHIYLKPLEKKYIVEILKEHPQIDTVLPTMGGQTALNLAIDCEKAGIWEKFGVRMIGVDVGAIETTEDREKFRLRMKELDVNVCEGRTASSFLQGKEIAQDIGFPLVIRPSYTLGYGGGFVQRAEDFDKALNTGLHASPTHEVLIEQSIMGWKEYELELLRDKLGNMIIICSVENFDPMGVHTGDSITVAPAMTLPDTVYQHMRDLAKRMINGIGTFAGGCNIQFAVNPADDSIIGIEINPRVSRSSALASKATGYPIAKVAARSWPSATRWTNSKTRLPAPPSAFFEPALDYVIVKIPRWNFAKFPGADTSLGLQMKAVGETMGIGRNFQEALQKACQSLEIKRNGLGADGKEETNQQNHSLQTGAPQRRSSVPYLRRL